MNVDSCGIVLSPFAPAPATDKFPHLRARSGFLVQALAFFPCSFSLFLSSLYKIFTIHDSCHSLTRKRMLIFWVESPTNAIPIASSFLSSTVLRRASETHRASGQAQGSLTPFIIKSQLIGIAVQWPQNMPICHTLVRTVCVG